MNRVFANLQVRAVNEAERVVEGVASTGRRDRMADEVVPRGIVYALPVPLLLDHAHDKVVGTVEHIEVTDTEVRFRARLPKIAEDGPAKTLVDQAWAYLTHGLRRSISVGFRPLAHERIEGGAYRYTSWELLEISAVGVPANPDAKVTATRAAKGAGHVAKLGKPAGKGHVHHVAKLGKPPVIGHVVRYGGDARRPKGAPGHVVHLTQEARERAARHERALAEHYDRQWRWATGK